MSNKPFMTVDEAKDVLSVVGVLPNHQLYANACREIIRLSEENARLREMVRWIPVGERLPEPDTNVLIFVSDKNVDDSDIQISDYEDRYGWGFLHNEIVTHWMPLPEPPEVK